MEPRFETLGACALGAAKLDCWLRRCGRAVRLLANGSRLAISYARSLELELEAIGERLSPAANVRSRRERSARRSERRSFCSARSPRPCSRYGLSLPREPVRVGEGPGVAADGEPVRSGAVRRDAGVLGERPAPVERQLDGRRRGVELDVLAAEALRHGEAAVDVELLARLARPRRPAAARCRRSAGWPGRCPSSTTSRPSRSSRPGPARRRRSPRSSSRPASAPWRRRRGRCR